MGKISIITPTYNRHHFLNKLKACFESQAVTYKEWLIFDDSPKPCAEFVKLSDPAIKYFHSSDRVSVGEKRNRLIREASGDLIIHFDDDDYYGPRYVADLVQRIEGQKVDIVLSGGFFVAPLHLDVFAYYCPMVKSGLGFEFDKRRSFILPVDLSKKNIPLIHLCFGFSYGYKRSVWEKGAFIDQNVFEDRQFIRQSQQNGFKLHHYKDETMNMIHTVHQHSTSTCFPQFLIPGFLVRSLNPEAFEHIRELRRLDSWGRPFNAPRALDPRMAAQAGLRIFKSSSNSRSE
jgi:glycosyltransferase involved in cell wall biosynthesis